jgi:hypothetical protein
VLPGRLSQADEYCGITGRATHVFDCGQHTFAMYGPEFTTRQMIPEKILLACRDQIAEGAYVNPAQLGGKFL